MNHRLRDVRRHALAAALLANLTCAQSPLTTGNIAVVRIGDGSAPLTNAATQTFLDEYTPTGTLVQSIALPTTPIGNNQPLTNSGTATSEGGVTQSADGRFLIVTGYGAVPGTASVASTPASAVRRVVGRIGIDGSVDTTTALGDAYSSSNIRSGCSVDGNQFWTGGTATAVNGPGIRHVPTLGATTSVQLGTTVGNIRRVDIFDDQLYFSTSSGMFQGVGAVGLGLPTTSGQTMTPLTGFPIASGPSPYDFVFADANTLYVADDRAAGSGGGIQKWTQSGGQWTLQYTLTPLAGCRGLSGHTAAGVSTLWATTATNTLVSITDTGPAAAFTTLATATVGTAFRSVRRIAALGGHGPRTCDTDAHDAMLANTVPGYVQVRQNIAAAIQARVQHLKTAAANRYTKEFVIPVVVHVVWRTAAERVGMAQIQSQIDVLNSDYSAGARRPSAWAWHRSRARSTSSTRTTPPPTRTPAPSRAPSREPWQAPEYDSFSHGDALTAAHPRAGPTRRPPSHRSSTMP